MLLCVQQLECKQLQQDGVRLFFQTLFQTVIGAVLQARLLNQPLDV